MDQTVVRVAERFVEERFASAMQVLDTFPSSELDESDRRRPIWIVTFGNERAEEEVSVIVDAETFEAKLQLRF